MKMAFHFDGINADHLIKSTLSDLLNHAEVMLDDIHFDPARKAVVIQLTRYDTK